jgi:hypothetical protein
MNECVSDNDVIRSPRSRVVVGETGKSSLRCAMNPPRFCNPFLEIVEEIEHPAAFYEARPGSIRPHDREGFDAQPQKSSGVISVQAAVRKRHDSDHFDCGYHL